MVVRGRAQLLGPGGRASVVRHPDRPSGNAVTFYATEPGAEAELRQKLAEFAPTLPDGVRLELR